MHQQLPRSAGVVVQDVRLFVFGDVAADQPDFVVADAAVGLFDGDLAVAKAFDLAADQRDTAFQGFEDLVLPTSAAIFRNPLLVFRLGRCPRFLFRFLGHHILLSPRGDRRQRHRNYFVATDWESGEGRPIIWMGFRDIEF